MTELTEIEIIRQKHEIDARMDEIRTKMIGAGITGEQRNEYQKLLMGLAQERQEVLTKPNPYEGRDGVIKLASEYDEKGDSQTAKRIRAGVSTADYLDVASRERVNEFIEEGQRKREKMNEANDAKLKQTQDELEANRKYWEEKVV